MPMQMKRAPTPAQKAPKACSALWNARIIARFEMPNSRTQRRRATGLRID
jgi:hypothetical protein